MNRTTILVTGGAGFIGSHMVKTLLDAGFEVVTIDDLSGGYRNAVVGGTFVEGDIGDTEVVERVLKEHRISAVMNFASIIQVGESMAEPGKYYCNNLVNMVRLLDAMQACGVDKFVVLSSAAVSGEPETVPIPESHPKAPLNSYGRSKWMVEQMLEDFDRASGLKSVSLRYFNAAGADPSGLLGERHEPETHLIPLVLEASSGARPNVKVFGSDYETPDGTCIRDYVHVTDLCQAHLLALQCLLDGGDSAAFNLGNGNGFSVQEVIAMAKRVTGRRIPAVTAPRRAGDPARRVADSSLVRRRLGWHLLYDALDSIIAHAWSWEQQRSP